MNILKNCFNIKNSLLPQRICFEGFTSESFKAQNEQMKQMEAAKSNPEEYINKENLTWDNVNTRIFALRSSAEADLKQKAQDERGKVKLVPALSTPATPDQKKDYEEGKNAYEVKILGIAKEEKQSYEKIWQLTNETIATLNATFEAKKKALDKLKEEIVTNLSKNADSEDVKDVKERAGFAANIADDGNLTSWKGEVQDYLGGDDSKIVLNNGREIKLDQSEVENITMGIASVLHDKSKEKEDPARIFMQGLSDKESASGDFVSFDDRGVTIHDVRLQVLGTMNFSLRERDDRKEAQSSAAGKLFDEISANQQLSPMLRGMLIGKLANIEIGDKISGKTSEQADKIIQSSIAPIQEMYKLLQDAQKNAPDKLHVKGTDNAMIAGNATVGIGSLFGTPGSAIGLGLSAVEYQYIDKKSLTEAGLIVTALEDAVKVKELEDTAKEWRVLKATSKIQNKEIDTLIQTLEQHPTRIKKQLKSLQDKISEAKTPKPAPEPSTVSPVVAPAEAPAPTPAPSPAVPVAARGSLPEAVSAAPARTPSLNEAVAAAPKRPVSIDLDSDKPRIVINKNREETAINQIRGRGTWKDRPSQFEQYKKPSSVVPDYADLLEKQLAELNPVDKKKASGYYHDAANDVLIWVHGKNYDKDKNPGELAITYAKKTV